MKNKPDPPMVPLYVLLVGLVAAAALLIWLTPHMLYAILGFLCVLLGIAAIYFLQGAAFVAVAHMIMYGGSVLVLILFGTFLLPLDTKPMVSQDSKWLLGGLLAVLAGGWLLVHFAVYTSQPQGIARPLPQEYAFATLGLQLLGPYALAFEWVGLSLLIALAGAIHIMQE